MKNVFRILKISKPLYGLMFGLSILIISISASELVTPVLSKVVIDEITKEVEAGNGDLDKVYLFILIGFLAGLVSVILHSLNQRLGDHFAGKIRKFLTEKFYDKIFTLPQSYYDTELSGRIVNQLNRGIATIQGFMNSSTNFLLPMLLQSVLVIGLLAYYNLVVAFAVFILFPIYSGISYYSTKKWGKEEEKKNKIEDATRGRIQEVVSNIRLVKGFTNEKKEHSLIARNLSAINKIYAKQSNSFHILDFARNLSLTIVLTLINIIVFYRTFQGDFTIGEMVLILQLVMQARQPLFGMSFFLTQLQQAESGSKEYFEILDLESKEDYLSNEKIELVKNPELEFRNVEFNYDTSRTVLKNVSFDIKNNEIVALVGPSGAGKSTVVNLILKFYETTQGEIFLNHKSYKELTPRFVRENISLVFQENELFSSTIKENVAYGQTASDAEVTEALRKANALSFVQKLPNGINSEIGERGVRLSGGQKQRIQIARAILKNAPILILDEATSSLDAKSESEVQDALENLMKNKLVIVIAHRFSTIQNATKVVVLNNRKVEAIGTPQELAKAKGIYADLLQYQIEGNKKLLKKFEIY